MCISFALYAQPIDVEEYLKNGKAEFYKEWDDQNYSEAIRNLEKAVQLDPNNSEAHYFLGYAYDRLNSKDGSTMTEMDIEFTLLASAEYEKVIELSQRYDGEILTLDPYSRLSSIWGSQAMAYLYNGKADSARWCFEQGKQRGGFSDLFLNVGRKMLDLCKNDAYLFTMGDNITIPLWYLQSVESYRADVLVIDVNMMNTLWYPKYLINEGQLKFSYSNSELDTLNYKIWEPQWLSIKVNGTTEVFEWQVEPAYAESYLLRADLLLLDLLQQNEFKRNLYFSAGYHPSAMLSLNNHLQHSILVEKVEPFKLGQLNDEEFYNLSVEIFKIAETANVYSQDELGFIDMLRYIILDRIYAAGENIATGSNKKLFGLLQTKLSQEKYPIMTNDLKDYMEETGKTLE